MSKKPPTTPATAAARKAGIAFTVLEYELDPRAESFGLEAADKLGLPPERVFKTLVVEADGEHLFAVVPVEARLNTRSLGKRVALADPDEARRLTGYVKGGTSVFGSRRRLPVLLDESALEHETIVVNGGRRGLQLELSPHALLRATAGRTLHLT
jgi:Cys-tRNA(Pro)/Cys-tRNA(Cys) deacylase